MASNTLDTDVETDCAVEISETDLPPPQGMGTHAMMGIIPRQPKQNESPNNFGIVPRDIGHKPMNKLFNQIPENKVYSFTTNVPPVSAFNQNVAQPVCSNSTTGPLYPQFQAIQNIYDDMIEEGAHVVFDWDNTLKLYNRQTRQLSCRVSKQFLLHLKHARRCQLYIISAIRPSSLNLDTLLYEIDKLGLTDVFVRSSCDEVDGTPADKAVVKAGEYAHKGNVIICNYDKAETFLKLSGFSPSRGDKVVFFDDEKVNIENFSVLVPNSKCFLCE